MQTPLWITQESPILQLLIETLYLDRTKETQRIESSTDAEIQQWSIRNMYKKCYPILVEGPMSTDGPITVPDPT